MSDDVGILIKSAPLRRLYRDWDARRAGRRVPARADFDPVEMKYILGQLSLIDVARDPLRFIFRLHATGNARHLGVDRTGKDLAFMPNPDVREHVRAHYELAVASREPVVQHRGGSFADGREWDYEVLVLPLASDGETIDMLMSGVIWNER
ncbi:MAG: PAS domain-containing protein [Alphaproteobacteria bacterium]|nr:PAS domain-containing protein [Alphaproteobacteria bacterium]